MISIFEDYTSYQPEALAFAPEIHDLQNLIGPQNVRLSHNGNLQVKHYIGFFQKGNFRLQILPKIYSNTIDCDDKEEQQQSVKFVIRLLNETKFLTFKKLDAGNFGKEESDLFEILIRLFIEEFHRIFNHNIFSDYVSIEDNLPFIKGKIDFPNTIKRNVYAKHLHYLHYDEFTVNNPLNQYLKSVIFQLLKITRNPFNKSRLRLAIAYLQDVDDITISPRLIQQIHFTRRNALYEPLYNLANLFRHNLTPGLSQGNENTFSFLIPLNKLFEYYVGQLLQKLNKHRHRFRHYKKAFSDLIFENDKCVYSIYPDYSLLVDKAYKAILDAKYKCPTDDKGLFSVPRHDVYQLTTYALHFGCKSVYLIYPAFKGALLQESLIGRFRIKLNNTSISLTAIQLNMEDLSTNEQTLRSLILELNDNPKLNP